MWARASRSCLHFIAPNFVRRFMVSLARLAAVINMKE